MQLPVKIKKRIVDNGFPGRDDYVPDRVVVQGLRGPEQPRVRLQEGKHHPGNNLEQEEPDHKAPDDNHDQGEYHQPIEELIVVLLDEKSARPCQHLEECIQDNLIQFNNVRQTIHAPKKNPILLLGTYITLHLIALCIIPEIHHSYS